MLSSYQIQNVKQVQKLDQRNQVAIMFRYTYMVGTHGPFTEDATRDEVSNGQALQRIQNFANTINTQAPQQ